MRLYRITRTDPPTEHDMQSHWDRGHRPARPQDEAAYKEVSVFVSAELAAAKARARNLGEYIAELDVPDGAPMTLNPGSGHVGLIGTTPGQLLDMVQNVQRVDGV